MREPDEEVPMMRSLRRVSILSSACAVMLAGCATTQMDAQWSNPEYSGRSLRGETVLIACEAPEVTLQRICEDQVAAQVSARGAKPTKNSTLNAAGSPPTGATDPYAVAAKRIGARAIVRTTLAAGPPIVSDSGPVIGFGMGGGSFGGGSYRSGGAGVTLPVGGARTTQALSAETVLINPANGVTMWSGRASGPTSQDAGGQVTELARVIVEAVQKSGML
jgi:hypothetical protein